MRFFRSKQKKEIANGVSVLQSLSIFFSKANKMAQNA